MPGTPRDIAYLESKFETGDIPTQQDFYDLFASFVHYLKIVQTEGSSTSNVMSQKAVTDALADLQTAITSVGELVGPHNASTGLPTTGSGEAGAIDKGDYWFITTPGTIGGLGDLATGDVLFAKVSGADEASEFFYLPFASIGGLQPNVENPISERTTFTHLVTGTEVSISEEEIQLKIATLNHDDLFENTDVTIQWFHNGGRVYVKYTGATPVKLLHTGTPWPGSPDPDGDPANPWYLPSEFVLTTSYQDIGSTSGLLGIYNRTWILQPVDEELKLASIFNGAPPLESSPPPASPTSVTAADNPLSFYSSLSAVLDIFAKEKILTVNRDGIQAEGVVINANTLTANELITTLFTFLGDAFDVNWVKAGNDRMEIRGGGETAYILARLFANFTGTLTGEVVLQAGADGGGDPYAALILRALSNGGLRLQTNGVDIPETGEAALGIDSEGQVRTIDLTPIVEELVYQGLTGLTWKAPVQLATTGNITLEDEQTIDGVLANEYSSVLVKDQDNPEENGVYIVRSGAWVRRDDSDDPYKLIAATYHVERGDDNADTNWVQTADDIEWEVDPVLFSLIGSGVPQASTDDVRAGASVSKYINPAQLAGETRPGDQGGTTIAFAYPSTHGRTTPETGNITADYTNAIIGQIAKIYHEHSSAPTFPSGWKNIGLSEYVPDELNIIIAEYVRGSGDRVEYFILQPDATKEAVLLKKTGKLTSAQILALGTGGGPAVVPAPGAGKILMFHGAILKLVYNSVAYATHTVCRFEIGNSVVSANLETILPATEDFWQHVSANITNGLTSTLENVPIKIKATTGNPTAGNSEIHYTIFYSIVTAEHA